MIYEEPLFRPPAEHASLIAQLTIGCSYNRCRFCAMYKTKKYRLKSQSEFRDHCQQLAKIFSPTIRRAFIADGDALQANQNDLLAAMLSLKEFFPFLRRTGIYASVFSLKKKTLNQLKELRAEGLRYLYLGLESGDDLVMQNMNKEFDRQETIRQCGKALEAGLTLSVTFILGLGGISRSQKHVEESVKLLNKIGPQHCSLLNLMFQGNRLAEELNFRNFDQADYLRELRGFVNGISCRTIFHSNHASNYLPLSGRLPKEKERLLNQIDRVYALNT